MSESGESDVFRRDMFFSLLSSSPESFAEQYKMYSEAEARQIYFIILSEVLRSMSKDNVERLKWLLEIVTIIQNTEDSSKLEEFHQGIHESFKNSNIIIFACKHKGIKVLDYVLKNITVLDLFKFQKSSIKPNDVDNESHSAFYYAIRSGDCELVKLLTNEWPHDYCSSNIEDVCNSLAHSYEELKLKNINLSEEIIVLVEGLIINYRFYSSNEIDNDTKTIEDIIGRIGLIIENVNLLIDSKNKHVNDEFLYITRFTVQNIQFVKYSLKSTYDKIPWEEIEFFLIMFISNRKKPKTATELFENFFLTKDKLLKYLKLFNDLLRFENDKINNLLKNESIEVIQSYFDNSYPSKKKKREKVIESIIRKKESELNENDKLKRELYKDYQELRDMHSLQFINYYLGLATSANANELEGQLVILRCLQVMGENLKNSWESPKMSQVVSNMLLLYFSPTLNKLLQHIRNRMLKDLNKSLQLINQCHNDLLSTVKNDIIIIKSTINEVIFIKRLRNIIKIHRKIRNSHSVDELESIFDVLNNSNLYSLNINTIDDNREQVTQWIRELEQILRKYDMNDDLLKDLENSMENRTLSQSNINLYNNCLIVLQSFQQTENNINVDINKAKSSLMNDKIYKQTCSTCSTNRNYRILSKASQTFHKIILNCIKSNKLLQADILKVHQLSRQIMYKFESNPFGLKYIDKVTYYFNATNDQSETDEENLAGALEKEYDKQLSALKMIFDDKFSQYRENKELQAAVEMLVLNILSILSDQKFKKFGDDKFFLDNYSPVLIGRRLRNHLAHGNIIVEILPVSSTIAVFETAKKLLREGVSIVKNDHTIGKCIKSNIEVLKAKCDQDLKIIRNQKKIFQGLENNQMKIVTEAMKQGADIEGKDFQLWTALHFAAKAASQENIEFVIKHYVSPLFKNNMGETALHIAAKYSCKSTVELLIKRGCLIDETDDSFKTALHFAVQNSKHSKEVVEVLLKNNSDTSILNVSLHSPLHTAIGANQKRIVEILLKEESHVDTNETDDGRTPLFVAAKCGHLELVEYLLEEGADAHIENYWETGFTPIEIAALFCHFDVFKILFLHKKNTQYDYQLLKSKILFNTMSGKIIEFILNDCSNVEFDHIIEKEGLLHHTALWGLLEVLNSLLKIKPSLNLNIQDYHNNTPLHYAVERDYITFVQELMKRKVDINLKNKDGQTPLHIASVRGNHEIVECLLEYIKDKKAYISLKDTDGRTALHYSSQIGNLLVTKLLLKYGSKDFINDQDIEGCTPLHYASVTSKVETIRILIKYGGDYTLKCKKGFTPFHDIIVSGPEIIKQTIFDKEKNEKKLDVDSKYVIFAMEHFQFDVAKFLIDKYKALKKVDNSSDYDNLLMLATMFNQLDIIKKLVKYNEQYKDFHVKDNVIKIAAMYGHENVLNFFYKLDHSIIKKNCVTLLNCAISNNHTNIIDFLLDKEADIDAKSSLREASLQIAVQQGLINVVKKLLSKKKNLLKTDEDLMQFLLYTACNELNEIFKLLLESNKYNVNLKLSDNASILLHLSAFSGNISITKYLIKKGVDKNTPDINHIKPIHIAAYHGHSHLVEYLVEEGLDINSRDSDGNTILHYAVQGRSKKVINYLFEKKLDVNAINSSGQTPLQLLLTTYSQSISDGCDHLRDSIKEIMKILLDKGAVYRLDKIPSDVTEICRNLDKLFHTVKTNNVNDLEQCLKILLVDNNNLNFEQFVDQKVVINATDSVKMTALHYATQKGFIDIAEKLLNYGANPNIRDKAGRTPLHYAAEKSFTVTRLLLSRKADPNIVDKRNCTPLHYAKKRCQFDIVKLLLTYGAIYNKYTEADEIPSDLSKKFDAIRELTPDIVFDATGILQIVDNLFIGVENNEIKVIESINFLRKLDMSEVVKNAQNIDGKTLTAYARDCNFSYMDELYTSLADNIKDLIKREKYRELFKYHDFIELMEKNRETSNEEDGSIFRITYLAFSANECPAHIKIAFDFLTEAYNIKKSILGEDNQDTLIIDCHRSFLLFGKEKEEQALTIYRECWKKLNDKLDNNKLCRTTLDFCSPNHEIYRHIIIYYTNLFREEKKKENRNLLKLSEIINVIGRTYVKLQKYDEVLQIYEREDVDNSSSPSMSSLTKFSDPKALFLNFITFNASDKSICETCLNLIIAFMDKKCYKLAFMSAQYALKLKNICKGQRYQILRLIGIIYSCRRRKRDFFRILIHTYNEFPELCQPDELSLLALIKSKSEQSIDSEELLKYCSIEEAAKSQRSIMNLLGRGDDVNLEDENCLPLLYYAIKNLDKNIIKYLLKENADCYFKKNTALHIAVIINDKDIVCILLEHAKRVMESDKFYGFIDAKTEKSGMTCLHIAANKGFEDIVLILLAHGATYNITSAKNKTPHDLCYNDIIKNLLKLIEDFFVSVTNGEYTLITQLEDMEVTKRFAILNVRNINGETLFDVALSNNHNELSQKIEKLKKLEI